MPNIMCSLSHAQSHAAPCEARRCLLVGSPAAKVAEAKALLRFSSLHGGSDSDVRAFSADVRAAVRDSMESLRSAALSNPSTRAPSLDNSRLVQPLHPAYAHVMHKGRLCSGWERRVCVVPSMCRL